MKILKTLFITNLMVIIWLSPAKAQEVENDFETRTSFRLRPKLSDKLKLRITPEVRLDEEFSIAKYILAGEGIYEPIKILALGAKYYFIGDINKNSDNEHHSRYAFSATIKYKFNRFEPAFRIRYSNYADDEITDKNFLRYKASLEYDIPKSSLTPFLGAELVHQLADNELYKMRYSAGIDFKLFKNNYISLSYKLDYYLQEYRNKHIVDLTYKINL